MAWDPITRVIGSLGIYTKIDFGQRKVVDCHSTSSIFRGYLRILSKTPSAACGATMAQSLPSLAT
jgi:Ni,Fe-hydrogenase I large subunit